MTPDGRRARRLGTPKPTSVMQGDGGAPRMVAGREVDSVREEWVVLLDGRNVVVFRDLVGGGWFLQRS